MLVLLLLSILVAQGIPGPEGVTPPVPTRRPEPRMPRDAERARVHGMVIVRLQVSAAGCPERLEVLNPRGFGLDESALEAVENWRFKPAKKAGQAVAFTAEVGVEFKLLHDSSDDEIARRRPSDSGRARRRPRTRRR